MFITDENNAFTKKWPSLVAKFGKTEKSKFGRIDSLYQFDQEFNILNMKSSRRLLKQISPSEN